MIELHWQNVWEDSAAEDVRPEMPRKTHPAEAGAHESGLSFPALVSGFPHRFFGNEKVYKEMLPFS